VHVVKVDSLHVKPIQLGVVGRKSRPCYRRAVQSKKPKHLVFLQKLSYVIVDKGSKLQPVFMTNAGGDGDEENIDHRR
jgi:hypothetical protein